MTKSTSRILIATLIFTGLAAPLWGHSVGSTLEELAGLFDTKAVVGGPDFVACTLSGGTETTCFKITQGGRPPRPGDRGMER